MIIGEKTVSKKYAYETPFLLLSPPPEEKKEIICTHTDQGLAG